MEWAKEKETIDVNVSGFAAMANVAMKHFCKERRGHLVAISSISALRGSGSSPSYSASKSFMSNYLEGLRQKIHHLNIPINITEIKAGFVDTPLIKESITGPFWVVSPHKAAEQIFDAIKRRKKWAYIPRRWCLVAQLLRIVPSCIYDKMYR